MECLLYLGALPPRSKICRPTEFLRSWEQEVENFLVSYYSDSEWSYSCFHHLIPGPMNPGSGRKYTIYLMWIQSILLHVESPAHALQTTAT